jgi:hypothetical protein
VPRTVLCLALLALLASGCRLGVRAEVDVARDGSGTAALVVTLDAALLEELDELAVDPSAELTAAAAAAPAWQLTREAGDDGSLVLTLRREADDTTELTDAFRELTEGLDERDPALAVDLGLVVDDEGAAELAGTAELRTPVGPGEVTDDAAATELARLAAESVDAELVVSLPGEVTTSDADEVDGSRLVWTLTPGEPRLVNATAAAPTGWTPELVAAAVAGVLLVSVGVIGAVLWRRRRADRAAPRA